MEPADTTAHPHPRLGLAANAAQFTLLVAVNALVGGMLGQERTVLPLLADQVFGVTGYTAVLTYVLAFGATKAITNFFAGTLSDRYGRKPVLVAGWLIGLPIPAMLIWGPDWGWILAANVLLGVNQGLTWSTTVIMKIDLVGPARRGLAMGLNEAAGYVAVAATAMATGWLAARYGLRPAPFLLGAAYAALGLGLSLLAVKETHGHARHEAASHTRDESRTSQVAALTSWREPALSSASQAGMVNNLNDGLAWGLFPVLFAAAGLSLTQIGVLAALYPAVWGLGQLATGPASDRWGRKGFIVAGMLLQGAALAGIAAASTFPVWALAAVALGLGTALVYPTLLAVIGDVAHPRWRARAVGVYRLWRDGGFAVGAILAGLLADLAGIRAATWAVAGLTAASGVLVWIRMYETHHPKGPKGQSLISLSHRTADLSNEDVDAARAVSKQPELRKGRRRTGG
ncbi:MAG TPA: MFS transporter [Micromonosporaceae bacterium]